MYLGIDVGGTNLKAGLVNESGDILAQEHTPLGVFPGPGQFALRLAELSRSLLRKGGIPENAVRSVGIGIPGAVSGGDVLYTANLPMTNVPLARLFRQHLDLPVLLGNDADCAAVGEWLFGVGRGTRHFLMITLGTGIGGGMILNGRLYTGMGTGGEVGHLVIKQNGAPCGCGRKGCWETYASATGLIRLAREAAEHHPESLLATAPSLDGRAVFGAAQQGDAAARTVCGQYAEYLASGLVSLANVLHPEAIALGGGVSAAPEELLLAPVREIFSRECYARHTGQLPRLERAHLGNDAGILGAALLGRAI